MAKKQLRLVLGDQLNHSHSWWNDDPSNFTVLICEARSETDYVRHHIQKVVSFFLAMRNFADYLLGRGIEVIYIKLDDPGNQGSITGNIKHLLSSGGFDSWAYQLPDEYRLDQELKGLSEELDFNCEVADTEHFFTTRQELGEFFKGKKTYIMESFYRRMRKKHSILMDEDQPAGGEWNYDKQNRKKLPDDLAVVDPKTFIKDASDVVALLEKEGVDTIGHIDPKKFIWPVYREEGLNMLAFFIEKCLVDFGDYQDAMRRDEWSVFHSRLSFLMNAKIISPKEVIEKVEDVWRADPEKYPISAVEGFIRQILGWREYMRGIYWAKMPDYAEMNYFGNKRKLPVWYWTGDTKMNCLRQAVGQSLDYSYAHHIQRLMITGNFALLSGIDPDEVDKWYLGVYVDAIEWVEITNTRGMSQFADGGIVGTKPYVSSANYIDKMSDYCQNCHYVKSKRTGDKACPFNSLFWNFYDQHRDKLEKNPRIGFVYRNLDKMTAETKSSILDQAKSYLDEVDSL